MEHTGVGRDHPCQPQGPSPAPEVQLSSAMGALSTHLKVKFGSCHEHIYLLD